VPACKELVSEYLPEYEAGIFSLDAYSEGLPSRTRVTIPPSIDPLAPKNQPMSSAEVEQIATRYEVDPTRPILSTVSRFDPWKDLLGVIDTYRQVRQGVPGLQLLLIASMAHDDPEGWTFYEKTLRKAGEDPDIFFLTNLRGVHALEVNAFQRLSAVGLLRSIREGFGLSVSESLWKGVPVVGTRTGGIPLQVLEGETGFLVEDADAAADRVEALLTDQDLRHRMGAAGREHVQRNFLITRHLLDYLRLFGRLEDQTRAS
jgi:trehalose synthase